MVVAREQKVTIGEAVQAAQRYQKTTRKSIVAKVGPSYNIMDDKLETTDESPEKTLTLESEQTEELRARYMIMLKYFHEMTAKLQELKQENTELKKQLEEK